MRTIVLSLVVVVAATGVHGATIQARLVRATHDAQATDEPLKDIEKELKKKFGYKYYVQMGSQKQLLKPNAPCRLDVGQGFAVRVTPKSFANKTHEVEAEWTSGNTSLVKITAKIVERGTLLFKGPAVGNDWIVLALTIHE